MLIILYNLPLNFIVISFIILNAKAEIFFYILLNAYCLVLLGITF